MKLLSALDLLMCVSYLSRQSFSNKGFLTLFSKGFLWPGQEKKTRTTSTGTLNASCAINLIPGVNKSTFLWEYFMNREAAFNCPCPKQNQVAICPPWNPALRGCQIPVNPLLVYSVSYKHDKSFWDTSPTFMFRQYLLLVWVDLQWRGRNLNFYWSANTIAPIWQLCGCK